MRTQRRQESGLRYCQHIGNAIIIIAIVIIATLLFLTIIIIAIVIIAIVISFIKNKRTTIIEQCALKSKSLVPRELILLCRILSKKEKH